MEASPRHSVSVAAAVVDADGRVLAVRRADNQHWEPPGGVLELDETVEDGVRREVREETGLAVEVEQLTGVYKNMARGIVALVFRCRPVGGALVSTEEAPEQRWLDPLELLHLMDEAYAVRLLDALRAGPPQVRSHDGVRLLPSDSASA